MPKTSRIRFVGGPWHNRIEEVEHLPVLIIQAVTTQVTLSYAGCFKVKRDRYYLASYQTMLGTRYFQYVHETLIDGDHAHECTWRERPKRWRINTRELERRLARAMRTRDDAGPRP